MAGLWTLQVVLLLVMFFMRKRVALTISLFHVAGKVFVHLPLLALQPFWTFVCLMLFWIYWITVLLSLGTSGEAPRYEFIRVLFGTSVYTCCIINAAHRRVGGIGCVPKYKVCYLFSWHE